MRAILALLLTILGGVASAQSIPKTFSGFYEVDLSGTSDAFGVQKPTAQISKITSFHSATFYCEAACEITLEMGTASAAASTGEFVTMSGGTATNEMISGEIDTAPIVYAYTLAAGDEKSINLSNVIWPAVSGVRTLILRVGDTTGLVRREIVFTESP
jgi:hypothetical protein